TVRADASVVQDSCVEFSEGGLDFVRVHFSVVNFSLPAAICDLHFTPEPFPAIPGCEILECSHPMGWSCGLEPGGGASWVADTPADCIPPGEIKRGFDLLLDPEFCCYIVQFTGPAGEVLLEQEECFTCVKVGVEGETWGAIKKLYR
ncbi:MAG: hypothetical protein ACE5G2_12410, partial [Candidatus Krumholzibacteriia bacterium]